MSSVERGRDRQLDMGGTAMGYRLQKKTKHNITPTDLALLLYYVFFSLTAANNIRDNPDLRKVVTWGAGKPPHGAVLLISFRMMFSSPLSKLPGARPPRCIRGKQMRKKGGVITMPYLLMPPFAVRHPLLFDFWLLLDVVWLPMPSGQSLPPFGDCQKKKPP